MTDRAKYRQQMVTAWEVSGLTQAEFCRRRGLKIDQFKWWKRQLVQRGKAAGTSGASKTGGAGRRRSSAVQRKASLRAENRPAFAEVSLLGTQPATGRAISRKPTGGPDASVSLGVGVPLAAGYEIAFPCGTSIRLPSDFDWDRASQLISTVTQSC